MKRKKGFTLIELLAVILILGIIALIAIPTVSKIVSDAKKGAFETTLKNIEKKVNDTCSMQQLKGTAYTTSYTITNGVISPSLDIKGNLPNGTINVGSNCNVTYTLSDNTYTGTKENESGNVEITKNNQTTTDESDDESNSKPTDNITYLNGTYKESLLNGADPKVESDMIPITIANNGTVTKADINSKWYEYGNSVKQWANVVLVTESSRPTYKNANPGTTINQEDILAYLVWIPRYKYAIPSGSGPRAISIVFENKSTPKSTGDATGVNYTSSIYFW